ncbi:hypothetical protein [Leeuwenhoekiella sp. H156]|uniref:hypothetical protein n=1 Tax=Leeuwenhoekiella sp. H156 TaxID=3450128 RepID=UPI003FA4B1E2
MIALRLLGEVPRPVEIQGHLSAIDLPGIYLAIVVLFLVFLKLHFFKKYKATKSSDIGPTCIEISELDILAQPKKDKNQQTPFTNFSYPYIRLKEFIMILILAIFYYWLIQTEMQ